MAAEATSRTGRRRTVTAVVAALAAALALVCAAALPFAPVERENPVVSWPQDPAAPVSTSLVLVAHAPAALRVETTCATARAAAERGGDVLFSTLNPTSPRAPARGVLWWVDGQDLSLEVAGTTVDSSPLPTGECTLALVTVPSPGAPSLPDTEAGAGVALQLQRDGVDVGDPVEGMPALDTLATGLTSLDAGAGERIAVAVAVNDEFDSSPGPLKLVLVWTLLVAGLAVLVCLWLLDRTRAAAGAGRPSRRAPPGWRETLRPRWADAATVALAVVWTPLAPMTDDDGYYAAMARDVAGSGYVGQYYQLYDQSFVPLTWPWYALSWWQGVADTSLGLRLPALAMVLVTWVLVRRCADLLLGGHPRWGTRAARGAGPAGATAPGSGTTTGGSARLGAASSPSSPSSPSGGSGGSGGAGGGTLRSRGVWLLALAYAAAWTPYVMGVRPEAISALGSALALAGVLTAVRTGRRLPVALGVLGAAMAAAAHPTGAVAIAPLVAGTPMLWRALRADRLWRTLVRAVVVVAPGAMATAAGFADGTLYDFVRGREVFEVVEQPLVWTDEMVRWSFLLNSGIPMGAYAKRTTVLVGVLTIALSLLLVAAARGRRLVDDLGARVLTTTAVTLLLAFVALWVTPSKWTHHFGSLSALTPLAVVTLLLLGPDLARRALASRGAGVVGLGVVAGVVAVAAVSMTGPDSWAYSWALGQPRYGPSPYVSVVRFSSPVTWAVIALVIAAALGAGARRSGRGATGGPGARPGAPAAGTGAAQTGTTPAGVGTAAPSSVALRTAAATTVTLLVVSTGYLVATFGYAAAATASTYSPASSRLLDPTDSRCGAAGALAVADDRRARPLPVATDGAGAGGTAGASDPESADASDQEGTAEPGGGTGGGRAEIVPPDAFAAGDAGVWAGDPAPPVPGAAQVWGSLAGGDTVTGELVTPWYSLDGRLADAGQQAVTALVAGDLEVESGNAVVAEYGTLAADGSVRTTTAQDLADGTATTEWRTVRLGGAVPGPTPERPDPAEVAEVLDASGEALRYDPALAGAADVVRLRAVDATTGSGGWVGLSAPSVAPITTVDRYLDDDAVVATSWQFSYHFPCERQVSIAHGVSDRPDHALLWGAGPLEGASDSVWQPGRGGLFSPVPEAGTLTALDAAFVAAPEVPWGSLARVDYPDAERAWDMTLVPETTSGGDGPSVPDLERYVPAP